MRMTLWKAWLVRRFSRFMMGGSLGLRPDVGRKDGHDSGNRGGCHHLHPAQNGCEGDNRQKKGRKQGRAIAGRCIHWGIVEWLSGLFFLVGVVEVVYQQTLREIGVLTFDIDVDDIDCSVMPYNGMDFYPGSIGLKHVVSDLQINSP